MPSVFSRFDAAIVLRAAKFGAGLKGSLLKILAI